MSDQPWQLESIDIMQSDKTTLRYVPESHVADAFRAGAEAMREMAAELVAEDISESLADDIRNLPIPEMK